MACLPHGIRAGRGTCGSRASAGCSFCCLASACRWGIARCGAVLIVSGAGVLVTVVTLLFMPEDRVVFAVLTLLGAAMLITGLLQPLLQKIPAWAGLVVSLLLFAATYHTQDGFWQLGPWQILLPGAWYANLFTAFFGFFPRGFFSTDYFPLLPWLFLFWAGYFLHFCMGRQRMEPLRRSVCPALGWMGRHSLLLYLLHQPVIYGVLSAAAVLFA